MWNKQDHDCMLVEDIPYWIQVDMGNGLCSTISIDEYDKEPPDSIVHTIARIIVASNHKTRSYYDETTGLTYSW